MNSAWAPFSAILDDETLALAGAPQLRRDRQDDGITIAPVLHSNLPRRGDLHPIHVDVDPIGGDDRLLDTILNEASQFEGRHGEPPF